MSEVGKQVRVRGIIKWFNDTKGFGFISCPTHNKDIFVHKSQVQKSGLDTLTEGQKVTFVVTDSPKGLSAISIQKE